VSRFGRSVDLIVRAASSVRGERVIHAKGEAFDGELTLLAGAAALDVPLARGRRTSAGPDALDRRRFSGAAADARSAAGLPHVDVHVIDLLRRRRPRPGGRDLVVAALPDKGGFLLATAEGSTAWTPFARLRVGEPLPAEHSRQLSFSVTNDAGGFRIGGRWRTTRAGAYDAARSVEP